MNKRLLIIILTLITLVSSACSKAGKPIDPIQLTTKETGHVARINVKNYGCIDIRLFDNAAPEAVKSFIDSAQSNFYNGKSVYNVIKDFAVICGKETVVSDHKNDKDFSKEINTDFYPLRGAVCLSDEGAGITADHFFIVNTDKDFLSDLRNVLAYKNITLQEYFKNAYGTEISDELLSVFEKYGGAPWLYGHSIVFGQITEGFDVLDRISAAELSDNGSYIPAEDIIIENIEIK